MNLLEKIVKDLIKWMNENEKVKILLFVAKFEWNNFVNKVKCQLPDI